MQGYNEEIDRGVQMALRPGTHLTNMINYIPSVDT